MSVLEAIVLGLVQGLTEFLPVSSSGHLVLTRWLLGWGAGGPAAVDKAFDVAVHVGTLIGAVTFLREDIASLVRSALGRRDRTLWMIALCAMPAGVAGLMFEDVVVDRLSGPLSVAAALAVFSVPLWFADGFAEKRTVRDLNLRQSLAIGVAQALALQPGVSRSGVTIAAARAFGYRREDAARVSFLASVPLIASAALFEGFRLSTSQTWTAETGAVFAAGAVSAGLTGAVSVLVLLRVARRSFRPFVLYRVAVALLVVVVAASRAFA